MRLVAVTVVATWAATAAGQDNGQRCRAHSEVQQRPQPCLWTRPGQPRDAFLDWLIDGCIINNLGVGCSREGRPGPQHPQHPEYPGYDGWYNNLARPSQGAVDTPLLRLLPPAYSDGAYQPASRSANPLRVSDRLMNGTNGKISKSGRTAFQVFFGQQVVEEILDAQGAGCPPEYFNIPVEEGHEFHDAHPGLSTLPLLRTRYDMTTGFSPNNPRQQLNEITPYMDGGLVYGTGKGWADVLRTFPNGSLAPHGQLAWHSQLGVGFPAENAQRLPMANPPPPTNHSQYVDRGYTANVDRFFKLGNPRGNENPFLLTFGIVWFRWHNHIAQYLYERHRDWNEERIFNEARKWVIATYQAIVFYDWLPKYIRTEPSQYTAYKPTTDPQVSHVFQSAAMRFGHTLVTSGVHLRERSEKGCLRKPYLLVPGSSHSGGGVRTCNSFWRSPELFTNDPDNFENFLMGLSSQSTEREDNIIVDDLRGRVFGPLEFSRRDLMAINIQRGRDHGLPDYNTARATLGLEPLRSLDPEEFKEKTGTDVPREVLQGLQEVYSSVDEVDIWAGGILETTFGPGQLFSRIILDQFERVRDGDRFWFENTKNDLFKDVERARLKQVRIIDVLLSITTLVPGLDIQADPFTAVHRGNRVSKDCMAQLSVSEQCNLTDGPDETISCRYLPQVSDSNTEPCTLPSTYDYFSGSEVSYILTFFFVLATCVAILLGVVLKPVVHFQNLTKIGEIKVEDNVYKAKERIAFRKSRLVLVALDFPGRRIQVKGLDKKLLRTLDMSSVTEMTVRHLHDMTSLVVTIAHHYDLFLIFEDGFYGSQVYEALKNFSTILGLAFADKLETRRSICRGIMTVNEREKLLAEFSRTVLENVFGGNTKVKSKGNMFFLATGERTDFLSIEITQAELASQLGMLPESVFVQQMFRQMDTDNSGFITMKEFWDVMIVFAQGTTEEKARLLFNIYDLSSQGFISPNDLVNIVKTTLGSEAKNQDHSRMVETLMKSVGLSEGQNIYFEQFKKMVEEHKNVFKKVNIDLKKRDQRESRFSLYGDIPAGGFSREVAPQENEKEKMEVEVEINEQENVEVSRSWFMENYSLLVTKIQVGPQEVFWGLQYTLVMFLIFIERAYYYSVEREHGGLRRIAGYGVTVTRGAASAMMFTYSTLLVTMCRNLFSLLRSSALHRLIPFDYMVDLHRYIGGWALLWTVVHIIGHAINFYHISTQTPSDLACLFRDFYRSTHVLPKFHYWCWETITGLTGVFLTIQTALIYVFAYFGRHHFFRYFWITHNTYPLFYLLMVLHGSGRLVQPPFFHFFFLGPCVLFVLDKLVSISRNSIKIDVIRAKQLPSNVTMLVIRRPPNFTFQSGQWVKIASTGIGVQEYHPFTLSSAPQEKNLTLHIRAVGPWTRKLAKIYTDMPVGHKYPEIFMDGPFGEGHQTWWDYEVVVLVAGGIGVTPFSSILKDIVYKLQNSKSLFMTKKVLFLWTTRSQKQYEWLTDVLREVEAADKHNVIRNHIFITQFKSKFDLRTIMLYLAERHFQRLSGTSLFTGLRAITHFGRPNFVSTFRSIKERYSSTSIIGVFTCGSPGLSGSVDHGCQEMNKGEGPVFRHYYENF